jgi:hypothetical protein
MAANKPKISEPKTRHNSEELSNIFCKDKPLITCLAKGGSWWQRTLMGTSVNVNFSERTLVQQQVIASPVVFGQKYQVNAGFVFDPAKLFISVGSWKGAFDEVQKIDKGLALLGASDVNKKSRRKPWRQPWAALVPKVELKVLSQFDYIKHQGLLIEAPFPERALNNWTFTWDLTHAIPDTKSRIDADAVDEALNELKHNLGKEQQTWEKQCHIFFGEEKEASNKIKGVHPILFSANSCQGVAKAMEAKYYRLYCAFKDKEGEKVEPVNDSKKGSSEVPGKIPENKCGW